LRFQREKKLIDYNIDLGIFHIINNDGELETHYRQKRLFGGIEEDEKFYSDKNGPGAAFLFLEAVFPELPLTKKLQLVIGAQKAFVVPWNYDKLFFFDTNFSDKLQEREMLSIMKTVFLSGFSVKGSIKW